jgi:type I restriction enzyme, S subunit
MKLKMKSISDVVDVNPRMPAGLSSETSRDVDFVPMANLSEQGVVSPNGARPLGEVVKGYTYFANGDVIVAKITPCMENGKAALVQNLPHEIAFGSTEFHVLRPGPEVDGRYLFYMVWNPVFRNTAQCNMTGSAGQKRVPAKFFDRFEVPLPPLSEQKRIADILDKADAIRRKRQDVLSQSHELRRSGLLEFTGDAATAHVTSKLHNTGKYLPRGFRWMKLEEICEAICDIDHNMPKAVEQGVPFISPKDMPDDEELDFGNVKHISEEDFLRLSRKIKPRQNDIIYSRIGARLGKARIVRVDFDFLASYSCCTIRVNKRKADPLYLTHYLDSLITRRQANLDTQSIAVPDLGLAKIKAFLVPVPTLGKQQEFASRIVKTDELLKKLRLALFESEQLFNSLAQRAFKGKM